MESQNRQGDRSALALVGGFEAYQNWMRQTISNKLKEMTELEVLEAEEILRYHGHLIEGLESGLLGISTGPKDLTQKNLEVLEDCLDFYRMSIPFEIPEDQKSYWETKALNYESLKVPMPPKLAAFLDMGYESDRIIEEKRRCAA